MRRHLPDGWDSRIPVAAGRANRFLARNSAEASWQFRYHKFGTITSGASFASWKDTFGYQYVVIGQNGNPMGRLDPGTYEMTASFGTQAMPSYVDLTGATYNVLGFEAGSDAASLDLEMYGTQTVTVKLPFAPTTVTSSNPSLIVQDWSHDDGLLRMQARGVRLTGQGGTITMAA